MTSDFFGPFLTYPPTPILFCPIFVNLPNIWRPIFQKWPSSLNQQKQHGTQIKHQNFGFQVNSSILAEIRPLYTFNIFNPITAQKTVLSKSLKHKALFLCLIISYGVCAENTPLKSLIFHNFCRINNFWNCSLHLIYNAIFFTFLVESNYAWWFTAPPQTATTGLNQLKSVNISITLSLRELNEYFYQ